MENQVSAIVCPNCGANTSNRLNCEYCGSMLVRFTDHGIGIDPTKYGKDAKAIDGLEEALAGNLSLQEICKDNEYVITYIEVDASYVLRFQIIQSDAATIGFSSASPLQNATKGNIALRMPFAVRSDDTDVMLTAKRELADFQKMDCFSLFTPQQYDGGIAYYIDCGKDTCSAAQIITQVMKEWEYEGKLIDFKSIMESRNDIEITKDGMIEKKGNNNAKVFQTISIVLFIIMLIFLVAIIMDL